MRDERYGVKCCVCGRGFTAAEWEDRHEAHRADCSDSECDCDLVAHAKHCPVCNPDKAQLFAMRAEAKSEAKSGGER